MFHLLAAGAPPTRCASSLRGRVRSGNILVESRVAHRTRILSIARRTSVAIAAGFVGVSIVSILALALQHQKVSRSAQAQLEMLADAQHLHHLLYQKGFVAEFFLTHGEVWLEALGHERAPFRVFGYE